MKDCGRRPQLASFLPDFARDAHGNLAEQNRAVGAQVGADTTRPRLLPGARRAIAAPPAGPRPPPLRRQRPVPGAPRPRCSTSTAAWPATAWKASWWARASARSPRSTPAAPMRPPTWRARSSPAAPASGARSRCLPQALPEPDAKAIAQWLAEGMKK
jgi:cytochrome c